jgi:hypothetical protein
MNCLLHTAQLSIKKGLEHDPVNDVIEKFRRLTSRYYQSKETKANVDNDSDNAKKLSLIKECETRWNST